MDTRAWRSLERELRDGGFGEAATAGLRTRLEKGAREIQVPFGKRFGADDVWVILHLRQGDHPDHYSLNSFDFQLRKAGHTDWLRQNFQQFGGPYTLQEAYNLLSGRPVYKRIGYNDGKPTEAWLRLDFDRKLENGNYAGKYYHSDDGFDLEGVLGRYPITELAAAGPRKELIDTLKRGDLAKVTMAGAEGVERKLFITPSIPTRSLLVQDENGIRLTPEKLVTGDPARVTPVAETAQVRKEIKQVGERQPVARKSKRQRLQ
jgi:hypothetical protein